MANDTEWTAVWDRVLPQKTIDEMTAGCKVIGKPVPKHINSLEMAQASAAQEQLRRMFPDIKIASWLATLKDGTWMIRLGIETRDRQNIVLEEPLATFPSETLLTQLRLVCG